MKCDVEIITLHIIHYTRPVCAVYFFFCFKTYELHLCKNEKNNTLLYINVETIIELLYYSVFFFFLTVGH